MKPDRIESLFPPDPDGKPIDHERFFIWWTFIVVALFLIGWRLG